MISHFPFSGNVQQAINPWQWWIGALTPMNGLINITQYESSNPKLEEEIIQHVAGYGKQLGKLVDAVSVLVELTDTKKLNTDQKKALQSLTELADALHAVKSQHHYQTLTPAQWEKILEELKKLKAEDKKAFDTMMTSLKKIS